MKQIKMKKNLLNLIKLSLSHLSHVPHSPQDGNYVLNGWPRITSHRFQSRAVVSPQGRQGKAFLISQLTVSGIPFLHAALTHRIRPYSRHSSPRKQKPQSPSFQLTCRVGVPCPEKQASNRPLLLTSSLLSEQGHHSERRKSLSQHPALEEELRDFSQGERQAITTEVFEALPKCPDFIWDSVLGKFYPKDVLKAVDMLVASNWEAGSSMLAKLKCLKSPLV